MNLTNKNNNKVSNFLMLGLFIEISHFGSSTVENPSKMFTVKSTFEVDINSGNVRSHFQELKSSKSIFGHKLVKILAIVCVHLDPNSGG